MFNKNLKKIAIGFFLFICVVNILNILNKLESFSGKSGKDDSKGEPSIIGVYNNKGVSKFDIKNDGSYIEYSGEWDTAGMDLQTADPNAPIPVKWTEKSRGKWTLDPDGKVLHVEVWPYKFGVKKEKLFYFDANGMGEWYREK